IDSEDFIEESWVINSFGNNNFIISMSSGEIEIDKVKLEKGSEATSFYPVLKGRNILLGSDDFSNLSTNDGSTYAYTALENGMTNIKATGGGSVLNVYQTLTYNLGYYRGERVTYSVKVKNNKPDSLQLLNNGIGVNEYVGPNETTTVNHTGIISPTAT